ncbi:MULTISPECIES: polysaccharide biosynthesis C-terminal domain-containing protein [unclassified Leifsonia]|uniref:polysaccharide biosynthesis C-terminal domain-containing protein n=1 Tax=unclassified Leifsonia TaxID=2663824 RepID=UPI00035ED22F|nr:MULTISPECIES: NAD-dependent epimerase/dehydratase family protein [unclassified Leifsonia]TDQ02863.1 UDP-2-acetamido-2,6-beta-L-arabino-hexul-4-ose reductase [Leifsonia sp. 115AMFTsu3.1]
MTAVVLTGARGFLGWHVRCALRAKGSDSRPMAVGDGFDLISATEALEGADRFIHIAGVNRGSDEEVAQGNLRFARQAAEALRAATTPPSTVVFANSTQALGDSVYGSAKARAGEILRAAADAVGADYEDVLLPNLFGEHGVPFYNSVVATFSHLLATGGAPTIQTDRELDLLHAQDAAELLIGTVASVDERVTRASVSAVLAKLTEISGLYRSGEIPDIGRAFDRDLFNTYRSFSFPVDGPFELRANADQRGSFFELIRAGGGESQASFSTTVPGVTRGDHFHRRKVERFAVVEGDAVISMRRLFTTEILRFPVSGSHPVAIDMPTLWSHNIENTGKTTLVTSFWANELFRPESPDTIAEAV